MSKAIKPFVWDKHWLWKEDYEAYSCKSANIGGPYDILEWKNDTFLLMFPGTSLICASLPDAKRVAFESHCNHLNQFLDDEPSSV